MMKNKNSPNISQENLSHPSFIGIDKIKSCLKIDFNSAKLIQSSFKIHPDMLKLVFFSIFVITLAAAQVRDPRCEVSSQFAIVFPHSSDCTKFYKCEGLYALEMDCPWTNTQQTERLHFNEALSACDWPWHANCTL